MQAWKTIAQTLNQPNPMTTDSMNTLEHIAYVRLALQFFAAGCFLLAITLAASAIKDARK